MKEKNLVNRAIPFSVSMSVYKNDHPDHFLLALKSLVNQTVTPNEIIVVVDGPIPAKTNNILIDFKKSYSIVKIIRLRENMGHGFARSKGLIESTHEYVALMDSDDICVNNRFELQINFLKNNSDISVLGGVIEEFAKETDVDLAKRKLPETDVELKKYMKYRCPLNQVTVMFKKADVIQSGGYKDWFCNEDYYLWVRMALNDYKFHNLQETLVKVRTGKTFYKRRGSFKYFKSEARLQKFMLSKDIISLPEFLINVSLRFIVQVIFTEGMRKIFFQTFTRTK
ncbi:glycosyltransferase [Winogradskyella sp. A3E31]|uniref:glycosyltransferase n=1 Tax=Winogradskyella sp. A3E31 TaxID=3349637 RepID=UPI00398B1F70